MVVKSKKSWLNSVRWFIRNTRRVSLCDLMKLPEERAGWIHGMMFMLGALTVVLFNQAVSFLNDRWSSPSSLQGGHGLNGFKPNIF